MGHICHMLRQEIIDRGTGCRWTPHGCVSEHLVVYRARWRAAVFTAVNWMVLGNVSGNWDWIICAVKLPGQPQAPWWLSSNWIPCKPLLALFWETVWDRSNSLWAVGTWLPYSAGQTQVALQSLVRNSPGNMWHADAAMVWGTPCPLLRAGASVSGSSPCTAHFRLGASSGRACERQSLGGFTGGF